MLKPFTYAFYGTAIGLIIGLMAGLGESNYYKKSQREFATPILSIIGGVVLGITGAGVGFSLGNELRKERILGIDNAIVTYDKQGRYWVVLTVWKGNDGVNHKITTGKAPTGELSSTYNDQEIFRHGINSGSLENVKKAHHTVMNQVFSRLKAKI